jgi:hypothetical protein
MGGVQASGGLLNTFVKGFEPTSKHGCSSWLTKEVRSLLSCLQHHHALNELPRLEVYEMHKTKSIILLSVIETDEPLFGPATVPGLVQSDERSGQESVALLLWMH